MNLSSSESALATPPLIELARTSTLIILRHIIGNHLSKDSRPDLIRRVFHQFPELRVPFGYAQRSVFSSPESGTGSCQSSGGSIRALMPAWVSSRYKRFAPSNSSIGLPSAKSKEPFASPLVGAETT